MTTTFIIGYIVVALIFIGFINFFVVKSRKKNKNKGQFKEQRNLQDSKSQQSKFKISDLDKEEMSKNGFNQSKSNDIEDDKRKHQFNDATEHITTTETGDTSHKLQHADETSHGVNQGDDAHDAINPNSVEGRVNEQIKNQNEDFVFGKNVTRAQIIAAMLFGMFIAILNQTLLNVALPRINTEFNISASTGQWLMTGFMLVNGILIPISAFYSINILIVNCLLSRLHYLHWDH